MAAKARQSTARRESGATGAVLGLTVGDLCRIPGQIDLGDLRAMDPRTAIQSLVDHVDMLRWIVCQASPLLKTVASEDVDRRSVVFWVNSLEREAQLAGEATFDLCVWFAPALEWAPPATSKVQP